MSINVKNITKTFGNQKALNNVSFEVLSGQIFGFLGPNGAGKSTMMKIITGYIPPSSGQVFVNNLDILSNSVEVKRQIGYLPENNPLYLEMYIKEYLQFVANIYHIKKNKIQSRISEVIEQTGLTSEINKKIGALSKGYRQRVGLAQAIIHDPQVLILDEPTSGLDPNQIIEIRNLISLLGKQKTVLLSTHIMQEVEAICNRIIIINNGVIVADTIKEDLHKFSFEKNTQTIIVEFNSKVTKSDLEKISGVNNVRETKLNQWVFEGNNKTDIRPEIFNFAVNKGITVLSMQQKEMNLEQVFHELTKH